MTFSLVSLLTYQKLSLEPQVLSWNFGMCFCFYFFPPGNGNATLRKNREVGVYLVPNLPGFYP